MKSLVAALVLAPAAVPATAFRWLAVDPGHRWEYDVTTERRLLRVGGAEQKQTLKAAHVEEVRRAPPRLERRSMVKTLGPEGARVGRVDTVFVLDASGFRIAEQTLQLDGGDSRAETSTYETPLLILPAVPRPGDRWTVGTMKVGGLKVRLYAEAIGFEAARTPAGTFRDCLKVKVIGTVSGAIRLGGTLVPVDDGSVNEMAWFAPGVGEVKRESINTSRITLPKGGTLDTTESGLKVLKSHGAAAPAPVP